MQKHAKGKTKEDVVNRGKKNEKIMPLCQIVMTVADYSFSSGKNDRNRRTSDNLLSGQAVPSFSFQFGYSDESSILAPLLIWLALRACFEL